MLPLLAVLSAVCLSQPAPAPTAPTPGVAPASATPTLDQLEPTSRKAVEEAARKFVVTADGKFWDRQLWLKRMELREAMRKRQDKTPTDMERALAVSATGPLDPESTAGGIIRTSTQPLRYEFPRDGDGAYMDRVNPPMWYAADGSTAITEDEISKKRQVPVSSAPSPRGESPKYDTSLRVPTAEELAVAIKGGRAALSKFSFTRTVYLKRDARQQGRPSRDVYEYSWFRSDVPVRWRPSDRTN